jgi:ATP-dependent Zn protease
LDSLGYKASNRAHSFVLVRENVVSLQMWWLLIILGIGLFYYTTRRENLTMRSEQKYVDPAGNTIITP